MGAAVVSGREGPGLPIVIPGGEHGDVPLEVGSGELVARMVGQERVSALLDLSLFRKGEFATFMTAFLEPSPVVSAGAAQELDVGTAFIRGDPSAVDLLLVHPARCTSCRAEEIAGLAE